MYENTNNHFVLRTPDMLCSPQGKDELLGRSVCTPMVKLNASMDQTPRLLWYPIIQKGQKAGEALLAAELILKDKVCPESSGYIIIIQYSI